MTQPRPAASPEAVAIDDREGTALVSVVIPAHDEEALIARVVESVRTQVVDGVEIEILVVDDASTDETANVARAAGARVIELSRGGSPAAARNRGAAASSGDPIVFLDADCVAAPGWLEALLAGHDAGAEIVGGAVDLPSGLSASARCDYYCGWYLVHSRQPRGFVPHHPPPNLSVRREAFLGTSGFSEEEPLVYTNEERRWQAEIKARGGRILFEPRAVAYHYNRPGFANLLRRSYRWAYTALEAKGPTGTARLAWLYRYPRLVIAASLPLAVAQSFFILGCWLRAGVVEPLWMFPGILVSRLAYGTGMMVGGIQWLRRSRTGAGGEGPRWV